MSEVKVCKVTVSGKSQDEKTQGAFDAMFQYALGVEKRAEGVFSLAKKGMQFTRGPKSDRLDNLGRAMRKSWLDFTKENGRIPTAFQVWDWIPEGGNILEKDVDSTIHWKRSDGKETKTTFKSFQNRYTTLKKKLSRSITSK